MDINTQAIKGEIIEIDIEIEKQKCTCIIDTGSEITVMDEEIYKRLMLEEGSKILELPVTNLTIIGVTGVRSKKITKQVYIDVTMGKEIIPIHFLIVKGLNIEVILGCDFFRLSKAKIDFGSEVIKFNVENRMIITKFRKQRCDVQCYKFKLGKSKVEIDCYENDGVNYEESKMENLATGFFQEFDTEYYNENNNDLMWEQIVNEALDSSNLQSEIEKHELGQVLNNYKETRENDRIQSQIKCKRN